MNSASGGITTYLLEYLINKRIIDAAITIQRNSKLPYFSYTICKNTSSLMSCGGSAYCLTPIGDIIKQIINDDSLQSIAIVALPCFCKAIRNACNINNKLRNKIKYIIGLVCGQQKSLSFSEYLAKKNNINSLQSIQFRTKKNNRPNSNYGVKLTSESGVSQEITFSSYAKEWSFKLFTASACNYCDDIFAETADIVLMDAWLPKYKISYKGENIIITRNLYLDEIIRNISTVSLVPIDSAIESQSPVIYNKRVAILEHLKLAKKAGLIPPKKREELLHRPSLLAKPLIRTKYRLSCQAENLWKNSEHNYTVFNHALKKWRTKIYIGLILNKINTIINKMSI